MKLLKELQSILCHQPFNPILKAHVDHLILQWEKLLLFNHHTWGSISWKTWLTQGDRNSRFFHNIMRKKITYDSIFRLKNDLHQSVEDHQEMEHILTSSFKQRFSSSFLVDRNVNLSFISPLISQDDCTSLLSLVTLDETKKMWSSISTLMKYQV